MASLDLRNNQLSGTIPASIGNLSNLKRLYLSDNQLSGTIPASIGNLSNLERLYLSDNQLSGSIPESIGNLSLWSLELRGNSALCLPESLITWANKSEGRPGEYVNPCGGGVVDRPVLVEFYKATGGDNWSNNTNWLSDKPLTEWHGIETTNWRVTRLYLSDNQLSGSIPASIGNLTNLETLGLSGNQLSGSIPASIGNLTNLETLGLSGNQLSGSIPASIGNLSKLGVLSLSTNQLSGSIPESIGNLTNLKRLYLRNNQLQGRPIPQFLRLLRNLTHLYLAGNPGLCFTASLRTWAEKIQRNDATQVFDCE